MDFRLSDLPVRGAPGKETETVLSAEVTGGY
jgi:hypothetical protein